MISANDTLFAEAYSGDIDRALGDSDAQVVSAVAAWERGQGMRAIDWHKIGLKEADWGDPDYRHRIEVANAARWYRKLKPLPVDSGDRVQ